MLVHKLLIKYKKNPEAHYWQLLLEVMQRRHPESQAAHIFGLVILMN
jgi:hypothetical protein